MNIIKVPISKVKPWEDNPRNIKRQDFDRLKRQIKDLGVYKPLIAFPENGQYIVLGGNMRLEALKSMKVKQVELSIIHPKTQADKIKYALSDNDNVGIYQDDKLAELIYPEIEDINLSDYKADIDFPDDLQTILSNFIPDFDIPEERQRFKALGTTGQHIEPLQVPDNLQQISLKKFIDSHQNIVIPFSGGKDSLAAAIWTLENCDRNKITLIYCDTGIDFPDVKPYLQYCEKKLKHPIIIIGNSSDEYYLSLIEKYGQPGTNNQWCSLKLKTEILFDYYKEWDLIDEKTCLIMGDRFAEGERRRDHSDRGQFKLNMAYGKLKARFACPLLLLSDLETVQLAKDRKISLYPGYLYFDRNGCYICPNAPSQKWLAMKENWPKLWIKAVSYLIAATKSVQYRDYFLRDIRKAVAKNTIYKSAPFSSFVDIEDINNLLNIDIESYNNK